MKIGPRRPLRDPQQQADLPMPEAFHVVQQDDRPLSRRQTSQRLAEPRPQVGGLPRIAELRRQALSQLVRVPHLPAARNIERRIGYYTVQPRAKRLVGSEPVQCAIGVQKTLLYRIFGIFVGRDD